MNISKDVIDFVLEEESTLEKEFAEIDKNAFSNSLKVLDAFIKENVMECDFNGTTGYGYGDIGRDKIERVFARVLGAEDALVRSQFISGTHALTVCLFGILRPNDLMLSICGMPYDTLHEVIGIKENQSSLKAFGVKYDYIDLKDNDFDYDKIEAYLKENTPKMIHIQRSRGYSDRESLTIDKVEKVIKFIRNINEDIIIMVDNCYTEFVEDKTPLEVGADVIVGSLIKNLGGGIAPNGGYIAGRSDIVYLASERLNAPGEAKEVGPSLGANKSLLMGLYHAPSVVASALKTAILASKCFEDLGYEVSPKYNSKRADIVQKISLNTPEKLTLFCRAIQEASAIDSNVLLESVDMPGYDDKIIMASGSFTQGSSIEISCDGPMREPYNAFLQGGLTYDYGKIAVMKAIEKLK